MTVANGNGKPRPSEAFWNGRLSVALAHEIRGHVRDLNRKTLNEYLRQAPPEVAAHVRQELKR